jgi:hypothetical protein
LWSKWLGASTVIGFDDQLALTELLFTSLLTQATAALVATGAHDRSRRQPVFRRSFLAAYAQRIGERLTQADRRAEHEARAEHGDALLPVLADRRRAVDEKVEVLFPHVVHTGSSRVDLRGWEAGARAADRAHLGDRQPAGPPPPTLPGSQPGR